MARVVDILRQVAPKASPKYLAAFERGNSLLQRHQIITPDRLAHFLAQILHESGGLTLERESMKYRTERLLEIFGVGRHSAAITPAEAQSLARDEQAIAERVYGLGNARKAQELGNKDPGDGFKYRGAGLMQTTGRANYRRMGLLCGVDFEKKPDLVFSARHALKPALAEWSEAGLNVYADNNDILAISRAINCGSPRSKTIPNGMQDRTTWFAKVRPLVDDIKFRTRKKAATELTKTSATGKPRPEAGSQEPGLQCALADLLGEQILRLGDEGPLVRTVQLALARLGYPLRGSGSFAARTLSAVKDFQQAHGLGADGEIGKETAQAIDRALAERSSPTAASASAIAGLVGDQILRVGDAGPIVQAVQLRLARLGYPLKGTGNYGPATEQAVRDFQTRRALEVDGEVGPEVATAIDRALDALSRSAAPRPRADQDRAPPVADSPTMRSQPAQPAAGSLADLLGDGVLGLGDQGSVVTALQLALAKLGYPLTGTGYFGGATEAAVTDFQQQRGLEVDGEVGAETAQAIDGAVTGAPRPLQPSNDAQPSLNLPGTDTRPLWVIEGLKWRNLREGRGAAENPDILKWARDEGGAIAEAYKHDEIPWCALFANMVLTKVGIKGTETLWALDWDKWGQKLPGPAVGAFAPMKRDGGGHIAIVVGRDKQGNLMCLGGNQSDAVSVIPFPAKRPLSFRWPVGVPVPSKSSVESLPLMESDGRVSAKES
ncbi:TIGR02594 family protein [Bradyrhizobium lablabi]|uniref:TIGR02594 family protein n=1 Tax=Bradyrhizobium lablabi TaxID=722472 RepID=UPI001BA9F137|nr:TIGR02594 family protein [Bradyrhizobium lablabi]MBR1123485.1 TIGR02594 family protein [Bradyrhizobium lablabi]